MSDVASSIAMIIFGFLIIIILLRVLMLVHREGNSIEELKRQLKFREQTHEKMEKEEETK